MLIDLLVGLAVVVGLAGVLVPVLPGSLLIGVAVLLWAAVVDTAEGWTYTGAALAVLGIGAALKYAVPGRRLRAGGVPGRALLVGGVLGIVGFFVVPVVGLFLGFVLGVYLVELRRVGRTAAWSTTTAVMRAVGVSILIELAAGLAAASLWLVGRCRHEAPVTAVLLALGSAFSYGLSDFLGGLVTRRVEREGEGSAWSVAVVAQVAAGLATTALAPLMPGEWRAQDALWALIAALGGGGGTGFLYRGLASGRMGVVAPVSGVAAAVLPVAVGLGIGERPGWLVWFGILAALPAIWLVSAPPTGRTPVPGAAYGGVLDGLMAGTGFGVLFAALGQVPDSSGAWPLALTAILSVLVVIGLAVLVHGEWRPRGRAVYWAAAAGPLGASAAVLFVLATQRGFLTISSVLAALYPAATVLLAAVILRERIHRAQAVGLALCAVAVVLVASG